jgi:UTP-glucose-1-phosphate uridylyltransferase
MEGGAMQTSLVIMAAGMGSRFSGGLKQLKAVGANGELIMDYSVHDAVEAGFNKIIFVIRREIEQDFREIIGNRIDSICSALGVKTEYVFQSLSALPDGFVCPKERAKPWGTGQAVLMCREVIHEPFAVINSDDYYGKHSFRLLHDFLSGCSEDSRDVYCNASFILKNTLSRNGGVTRGICRVDDENYLTSITETRNVRIEGENVCADGRIIDKDAIVSMNMWGFTPDFLGKLQDGFTKFLTDADDLTRSEFLLPAYVGELLKRGLIRVKILETTDSWFGMTYSEDVPYVREQFVNLVKDGCYSENLYEDLI